MSIAVDHPSYNTAVRTHRSTFVTLLAWIMILFSGLGLLISLAYNLAIRVFFTQEKLDAMLDKYGVSLQSPALEKLYSYLGAILLVVLVFYIIRFIMAIFLLKRRNWSRILHMIYFIFALFVNLFVLAMMAIGLYLGGDEGTSDLQQVSGTITSVGTLMIVAIIVFCGIYIAGLIRLSSDRIRNEFS
jgi:hypothetical protein